MSAQHQADRYLPPVIGRVWVVGYSGAGTTEVVIDGAWRSRYVTMQAEGNDMFYALGVTGQTLDETGTGSPDADGPARLVVGTTRSHWIGSAPADFTGDTPPTRLLIKGAGVGTMRLWVSSP